VPWVAEPTGEVKLDAQRDRMDVNAPTAFSHYRRPIVMWHDLVREGVR
jgi:hypothetical protein